MGRIVLEAGPAPLVHGRAEIEEPLHRIVRGGQGEPPPGPENAQGLVEARRGRPGVLDHLHEAHEIEGRLLERQRLRLGDHHGKAPGVDPPGTQDTDLAGDEARAGPEQGREEVEVASVPRTQIQHGAGAVEGEPAEPRGHELGERFVHADVSRVVLEEIGERARAGHRLDAAHLRLEESMRVEERPGLDAERLALAELAAVEEGSPPSRP